jgi:hypothetical protein
MIKAIHRLCDIPAVMLIYYSFILALGKSVVLGSQASLDWPVLLGFIAYLTVTHCYGGK